MDDEVCYGHDLEYQDANHKICQKVVEVAKIQICMVSIGSGRRLTYL